MSTQPGPSPTPPSPRAQLLQRHLSRERMATYVQACGGDVDGAVDLYQWNATAAGALWESLGHTEVILRNALHEGLSARHNRLNRPGHWFDDPAGELDSRASADVRTARGRASRFGAQARPGKIIAELPFGFWRFLLARRYTANLWPAMRPAFPHSPSSDRLVLEEPVARLHTLRNRVAHHEPLLAEDLDARYADLLSIAQFVHPELRTWVDRVSRLPGTLSRRP